MTRRISMEDKIIEIIKKALECDQITAESSTSNVSEWDSLGHLSVLSALDEATNGRVSEIRDFNDVQSVQDIVRVFEKHQVSFN
jgi:acyl carrier protein